MRSVLRAYVTSGTVCAALMQPCAQSAWAQQAAPPQSISLDSLLSTRISAASKYQQTAAAAPASVTILSSDDLAQRGYRTLQEVLENVRGFYVSNDRNFAYLGARGFSRPSDYNNRILLLVDGHTLNDRTWGGAPIGSDLPLNMDAIERIEIVRGPGSSLYGTNAMFGIVNIVTKTLARLDGVIVGGRLGSAGLREGSVVAGRALGKTGAFTVSGLMSQLDGADLYYPEFDTPQTSSGVARGLDWERSVGGLGAVTVGNVVARIGYRSRSKGIPTAAFGAAFNDPRAQTVDETFWGNVAASHEFDGGLRLTGRLYADRYRYSGVYPIDAGPAYSDGGGSTGVGGEGLMVWEASSRHRLTVGTELRHGLRADYYELFADGSRSRDDAPATTASVFSQDEVQLSDALTFVGGLRWDRHFRHSSALSPRLAILFAPTRATTIKALYGEAFRAPSAAEADITTTYYTRNAALKPERIRTLELSVDHRVGAPLLASGSLYRYHIRDLIDQVELPDGSVRYGNAASASGAGAEVEFDFRPDGPVSAHASYALQRARAELLGQQLTNSPEQIAVVTLTAKRRGVRVSGLSRYESGRRTISGPSTPAFIRTDANVTWSPAARSGAEVGLRVTNLFDVRYETPGGVEHVQRAIAQDGRAWSLRLSWRF